MKLDGKVALITDAASPSGKAIAERFSREGARLILNTPGGTSSGPDASGVFLGNAAPADKGQIDTLVKAAVKAMGGIDILVHNNNHPRQNKLLDCTDEEFLDIMDSDAKSAFLFTQAVGRRMKKAGSGRIIFVSSIHAEKPTGCTFPYSLAKGAVKMLAKETALDLGPYGVQTNTIERGPSAGDEEIFIDGNVSYLYENLTERIPDKTLGTPEELAELALFFACGDRVVNGADLRADGGFLLSYIPRYNYETYQEKYGEVRS